MNPGNSPCLWGHVLTQMKFLNLWPREIDFIVHVEDLVEEMRAAGRLIGVSADLHGSIINQNERKKEGKKERKKIRFIQLVHR